MVAPFIPLAKPPVWALLDNYTIGPDALTPTKVDSTSVAPNGHIAGKDFASTGPEQNDWQFLASHIVGFVFDSLATSASQNGADDRRVMITDDDGFIDLTGIRLRGSNSVVSPTLLIEDTVPGAPAIDVTTNSSDDPGLFIRPGALAMDGWLAEFIEDGNGKASGLTIELGDPDIGGLQVIIDNSSNAGDGLAIVAQGGDGSLTKAAGHAILAIAGTANAGGPAHAGFFLTQDNETTALKAQTSGTALAGVPAAEFAALNNGDGMLGICVDGYGGVFRALGDGAPVRIVPKTSDPTGGSSDLEGTTWILNSIGAGDQHDLRVRLGPASSDRRWVATYQDQHVRATGFFPGPFTETSGTSSEDIVTNFDFPLGGKPQQTNIFCLVTCTLTISRNADSINGDDRDVGFIELIDVGAGSVEVFKVDLSLQSGFTQLSGPLPGDPITWGDRRQLDIKETITIRKQYQLASAGDQDFDLRFRKDSDVTGGLVVTDVFLEIETNN